MRVEEKEKLKYKTKTLREKIPVKKIRPKGYTPPPHLNWGGALRTLSQQLFQKSTKKIT